MERSALALSYRTARADDADSVAGLHAESWRRHYRGAYLDTYLDGPVFQNRAKVWRERLANPEPGQRTIVAVTHEDGRMVGFAHVILGHDPELGALLENLHVVDGLKRCGVGTRLTEQAARTVLATDGQSGIYLAVLEQNVKAQRFYRARGGVCVRRRLGGPFPGGGRAPVHIYSWPDPSILLVPSGKST